MSRINALASTILMLAGLNIGVSTVFSYNFVARVLNHGELYHIALVATGVAALVALADHFGWSSDDA